MSNGIFRYRNFEEFQRIPETKLKVVFDFLHYFRICLESPASSLAASIQSFTGSWNDMEESDIKDFLEENNRRRHKTLHREPPRL
jgi:hypothetical protein